MGVRDLLRSDRKRARARRYRTHPRAASARGGAGRGAVRPPSDLENVEREAWWRTYAALDERQVTLITLDRYRQRSSRHSSSRPRSNPRAVAPMHGRQPRHRRAQHCETVAAKRAEIDGAQIGPGEGDTGDVF